ncbi:hypothetical protein MYCTH_2311896 [Thermothelomyces thermophilus ATCC 42464]|uniref:Glucan 1, 4-alpha-glucosidase n=1 Tax=Thermothelomyces thermophilus (strain ATCC 42464 / BCRC 31852 / DSM 1799) TaxID=573729 RepID=G2QPS5_THET4|nr:uncharacterized protein MYCTH_2311896 [Thermothelomyces thermophilus ATCC 42464]AEO61588.1 hypothetical protein MYCTH_2311896 [Thermothelomyces thermophilus ATCC 42464]
MSSTSSQSPPKRPRLSLQIKALANGPSVRTSRCLAAAVDVTSPTSFNTLSNVYATAIDRSTPIQEVPPTAIPCRRPMLKLQTQDVAASNGAAHNTPYLGPYLDTPVTSQAVSPAVAKQVFFPSAMTATPPLSAQPHEQGGAQVFFTSDGTTPVTALSRGVNPPAQQQSTQNSSNSNKRRTTMPVGSGAKLPYIHPRSLRSILRNSPLPPSSAKSPESPRRQSRRLQEKALRRVAYNSPLEQEITTSRYTKSHIDLLAEEATPISPSASSSDDGDSLDQAMADAASGDNTRDGGQTPGPFEEMRRRMAGMHASSPTALSPTGGGIRKRGSKRREKKRRWVWTIGQDEDGEDAEGADAAPAVADENVPAPPSVPLLSIPAPRPRTRSQQAQLAKAVAAATGGQPQQQQQQQTQVPLLAVPVAPARAATANPPAQPPTPAPEAPPSPAPQESQPEPQPQPHPLPQQQHQQQTARELTPIPASLVPTRPSTPDTGDRVPSCATDARHATPEGMIEPPTPGMESTTSACSSQHSGREEEEEGEDGDVDMSDASSFTSVEDVATAAPTARDFHHHHHPYTHKKGTADVLRGDADVEMDDGTPTMTARPVGAGGGRGWVPWRDAAP